MIISDEPLENEGPANSILYLIPYTLYLIPQIPNLETQADHITVRNPWRFSFDRLTGDLYIGDVGENAREEINVAVAPHAGRQANFGWRLMEGFLCFNPSRNCNSGGLTLPVLDYPHPTRNVRSREDMCTEDLPSRRCTAPISMQIAAWGL